LSASWRIAVLAALLASAAVLCTQPRPAVTEYSETFDQPPSGYELGSGDGASIDVTGGKYVVRGETASAFFTRVPVRLQPHTDVTIAADVTLPDGAVAGLGCWRRDTTAYLALLQRDGSKLRAGLGYRESATSAIAFERLDEGPSTTAGETFRAELRCAEGAGRVSFSLLVDGAELLRINVPDQRLKGDSVALYTDIGAAQPPAAVILYDNLNVSTGRRE
jgi:hypothetical protein